MRIRLACAILFLPILLNASSINKRLAINTGLIEAVDSIFFAYGAFNNSNLFEQNNALIQISLNDTLILNVVNNDSVTHHFDVKGISGASATILAGDSSVVFCIFHTSGVYIYFDPFNYPINSHLGLGGMISVENGNSNRFYWNIKEHEKALNDSIADGFGVNFSDYEPDYFLINGNSNPDINNDTMARIVGNVGDTIHICIANTGQGIHSIHFHGYHSEIIMSSKYPNHVGRSKDTFVLYPMESMILQLVPDKPGEFPVHDHNLVAVTGGHIYPNGMFLTMLIN